MRILVLGGLLIGTSVAHGERSTAIHIGGMFGATENAIDDEHPLMMMAGGPRVTLAWENPMPVIPMTAGRTVDFALVPELTAAAILNEQHGEVMLGVGARAEIRMAVRSGGIFGNAQFSFYGAGRLLVIGDHKDTAVEGAMGTYVYLGKTQIRFGGEIHLIGREQTSSMYTRNRELGVFSSAYLGWTL
ncbi:MAG: hypothetical protein JWP01_212 [Myxococcales bacterium]|nr:hypothetical protein [Myxococcales bacterium]